MIFYYYVRLNVENIPQDTVMALNNVMAIKPNHLSLPTKSVYK
jgi:hypothetical protein